MLTSDDRETLQGLLEKAGLPTLEHININYNLWTVATWNLDDVPHFANLKVHEIERHWEELANTDRKTSVSPLQLSVVAPRLPDPLQFQKKVPNILTKLGLLFLGQLNTGIETTNYTQYCAVGDQVGPGDPDLDDVSLDSEADRKAWTDAVMSLQTEKYTVSFEYADFGATTNLTEAGGFSQATGNNCNFRVTFLPKTIASGQVLTLQSAIQHINGIEL